MRSAEVLRPKAEEDEGDDEEGAGGDEGERGEEVALVLVLPPLSPLARHLLIHLLLGGLALLPFELSAMVGDLALDGVRLCVDASDLGFLVLRLLLPQQIVDLLGRKGKNGRGRGEEEEGGEVGKEDGLASRVDEGVVAGGRVLEVVGVEDLSVGGDQTEPGPGTGPGLGEEGGGRST